MTIEDEKNDVTPPDTTAQVMTWAKVCGAAVEDAVGAILGFIPNGFSNLYDSTLKPIPHIGLFFQHRWTEESIKLITGITIGQVVARDIARFIFRPLGFALGAFMGSGGLADKGFKPHYNNQISNAFNSVAAQTVGGATLGGLVLGLAQLLNPAWQFGSLEYAVIIAAGGGLGLTYRAMMLAAVHTVTAANSASTRLNADRALKFASHLKSRCKISVRDKVKAHARDIIVQVNGEPTESLDIFFAIHLENVANSLDKKIDRHLNLLTDRAVHGDFKSLKRLAALNSGKTKNEFGLEAFLERVFNHRAVQQIKDAADTYYDVWQYRDLKG
jgi:hypothetical protein